MSFARRATPKHAIILVAAPAVRRQSNRVIHGVDCVLRPR